MPVSSILGTGPARARAHFVIAGLIGLTPGLGLAQTSSDRGAASANTMNSENSDAGAQLPSVDVVSSGDSDTGFVAKKAQVNKSDTPLSETPQSVTVVTRAVLDSEQAQSLSDALHNVPGVVSGQYGRRGWDDLIIRGQVASNSLYLDGLRTSANSRVAEQLYGLEQVEVLKGPASLLYGLVLPGGLVNMVSKRPQADAFANVDVTVGSYDLYQTAVDMNTPLSDNGKAAFRINALTMNANDATDYVWYKNRWIAPSLSLDFGARTDFTILASYQERSYIRQQGLPLIGSVLSNPNGALSRSLFTGEPTAQPYMANEGRIGYSLTHRFDDGWTLNNNFRYQQFTLNGVLVANSSYTSSSDLTLKRTATKQHYDGDTASMDTNVQRSFATAFGKHALTLGTDYMISAENVVSTTCTVGNLSVYRPVYTGVITCPGTPKSNTSTTVRTLGMYVRDQINFAERWQLVAGLRHDDAATYSTNNLNGAYANNPSDANTGSVALMVEALPGVRPYLSYATSFYPNGGTDINGNTFKPETGSQSELGVKFDLDGGRSNVTMALFNLRRKNVLAANPVDTDYSIAVGEERSRGIELGLTSDFKNGLSLMAGYAYTAAVVVDDGGQTPSTNGTWLNNVPRHTFNINGQYRFSGELSGWEADGGVRGQSRAHAYTYQIPGYVVADAGVAYNAARWRAALTIKNILNTYYYAGGLSNAVALGDDRTIMLTLGYRY